MINSVWKVCKQLKNSLNWFKPKLKTNIQMCVHVYMYMYLMGLAIKTTELSRD